MRRVGGRAGCSQTLHCTVAQGLSWDVRLIAVAIDIRNELFGWLPPVGDGVSGNPALDDEHRVEDGKYTFIALYEKYIYPPMLTLGAIYSLY